MRRLITLHIGRGLALYRPALRLSSFFSWVWSGGRTVHLDLPGAQGVALQLEGLHPVDAAALARSLRERGLERPELATNDAATINAIADLCSEGELRIVSYGWGRPVEWDLDQMMAFHMARAASSSLTPAAMLLKLGLWP